jgi:hypothetical protein
MTTTDSSVPAVPTLDPEHQACLGADAAPVMAAVSPGSRLDPETDFPEDLTVLDMAGLQVLHSRITRQLDHDHLTDPAGPHPATTDRLHELVTELDTRDNA